jgi:uncharacterized protein DUF6496
MLKYRQRIQNGLRAATHSGRRSGLLWRTPSATPLLSAGVSLTGRIVMPAKKKSSRRKYSKKASSEVRTEMRHKKSGKHKIKSRKQAIAIGLSKARKKGAKVPKKK